MTKDRPKTQPTGPKSLKEEQSRVLDKKLQDMGFGVYKVKKCNPWRYFQLGTSRSPVHREGKFRRRNPEKKSLPWLGSERRERMDLSITISKNQMTLWFTRQDASKEDLVTQ